MRSPSALGEPAQRRALLGAAVFTALLSAISCAAPETEPTPEPSTALTWPNADSLANSDAWIAQHHAEITQMRPRVLALNFVNASSNAVMVDYLERMIEVIAESSRYHGYSDDSASAFLRYEIAYAIDMRDPAPPAGWRYNNSSLYPREDPVQGTWGLDYQQLFGATFAEHYGIEDPEQPGRMLDLCELVERGLVHEIWIYGDADTPDVAAAEILELKPYYDSDRQRLDRPLNRCAGNGCFDADDILPAHCTRSIRIAWYNHTRGPGCFLESLSHSFESIGAWNPDQLPSLSRDFVRFSGHDLDQRYGLGFDSWYACPMGTDCLGYPSETSVDYDTGTRNGTIDPYDPVCGSAHFAPNGRSHYDLDSPSTVLSSCERFGLGGGSDGGDRLQPYTIEAFASYRNLARDCMGPHLVHWRQSFPGYDNRAIGADGDPILNWWPYLFY